jgi:hypothetical protein
MPLLETMLRLLRMAFFMAALYPGAMASGQTRLIEFKGICNASGAVAVDEDTILVGDDELSALSMFRLSTGQLSGPKIPLPASYGLKEADIEAGSIVGDRVVWISSHGRNSKGEPRRDRYQLFASHRIEADTGRLVVDFTPSYHGLPEALLQQSGATFSAIKAALGDLAVSDPDLAPKKRGLNIEGMTADRSGDALLIGLRNPRHNGKALVIRLENPQELMIAEPKPAIISSVHELDLGDRGIRDIEWSAAHQSYLVIAGQPEDDQPGPGFAVYKWDGGGVTSEVRAFGDFRRDYQAFHPEVIVPLKKKAAARLTFSSEVLVLSDDGNRPRAGGRTCKDKGFPESERSFRGVIQTVD